MVATCHGCKCKENCPGIGGRDELKEMGLGSAVGENIDAENQRRTREWSDCGDDALVCILQNRT